jgi:DNA-binding FadR family transcriptional regulator
MARDYRAVMRELLDAIVGGAWAEGAWLPAEAELRLRFGCGRGILREALRGLQERGVVLGLPGRGALVRQREYWDTRDPDVLHACIAHGPEPSILADTIDARTLVEQVAAELAIVRATDADLNQLAARVAELADAHGTDRDRLVAAETWFHLTLALLSGNAQLAKLVEPWHGVLAELRAERAPSADRAVVLHHRRILEGVSSREPELARAAVAGYGRQLKAWLRARR